MDYFEHYNLWLHVNDLVEDNSSWLQFIEDQFEDDRAEINGM